MSNMKINNPLLLIALLISTLCSCKPSVSSKTELIEYINKPENELSVVKELNDIKVSCSYYPVSLLNQQLKENVNKNKKTEYIYFNISFSKDDKELLKQLEYSLYSEMVQVLSFRMSNYISILGNTQQPLVPVDCFFQNTYGLSQANELLVVFNKKDLEEQAVLKLQIMEFGLGLGNQIFEFNNQKIEEIDQITY